MRSRAVVVASALGVSLVSGGWLMERGLAGTSGGSVRARARLFDEVVAHVSRYYVDTLSDSALYRKAIDGVLLELGDPHSVFLSRERLAKLNESTTGRYAGVGVQIDTRDGWITVIAPLPRTPAQRAGIQAGDRIAAIDGKPTRGWTADEAMKALRGAPGTAVRLGVERAGVEAELPFTLAREEIHVQAVQHATLLGDGVGYVDFTSFSEDGVAELRQAIDSLRRTGMGQLILDLRGNPGGLLEQGVAVSDLFLDEGERIVSMKGRTPDANREFVDRAPSPLAELPMVVLVDSGSASASEIVAGALQDHDRAALVGTTTYGKGSAQTVFPMATGGALKLTTARWFTPSGRSINQRAADDEADGGTPVDTGAARPRFSTDRGRTVLGGGGITPDVVVPEREPTDAELAFQRALGKKLPEFQGALTGYALELRAARPALAPAFQVTPQMRDALWARMQARGIVMDRAVYDAAAPLVTRLVGDRVAQYALGPDAAFLRAARQDEDVTVALSLLNAARTQREVLDRAAARAARRK